MRTYPAITLHQPWASWITWGLKTIETRTHDRFRSLLGKRIAIHASKKWDDGAFEEAGSVLVPLNALTRDCEPDAEQDAVFPRGVIVCLATVQEIRPCDKRDNAAALCCCEAGHRMGLVLVDVEELSVPLPAKGRQGIWRVELPE